MSCLEQILESQASKKMTERFDSVSYEALVTFATPKFICKRGTAEVS